MQAGIIREDVGINDAGAGVNDLVAEIIGAGVGMNGVGSGINCADAVIHVINGVDAGIDCENG